MGHPVLKNPAARVEDPSAPEIQQLIRDMIETLADSGGIGLAATQVYVPLQVLMFYVPAARMAVTGEAAVPLTILINPVIEPLSEIMEDDWEACLSVPGLMGKVPRFRDIRYSGQAPDGQFLSRQATGYHARVVQHEADHLFGRVYPQRMTDLSTLIFREELKHQLDANRAQPEE